MERDLFNFGPLKRIPPFFPPSYSHVLLATVLATISSISSAATVTLQFDAIVGPPRQGVSGPLPQSWGTSLQQGEIITGRFTFEPLDAPSDAIETELVEPFDFSIRMQSRTVSTSQYGIEVMDDSYSIDSPIPEDRILVGCAFFGGPKVCTPRTTAPNEQIEWSFAISFSGDHTVLDGPDVSADPMDWQRLAFSMTVTFIDAAQRYYGFTASPRSFQLVPEPGVGGLFILGGLFLLRSRTRQTDIS
jgi:hypothetical protein